MGSEEMTSASQPIISSAPNSNQLFDGTMIFIRIMVVMLIFLYIRTIPSHSPI